MSNKIIYLATSAFFINLKHGIKMVLINIILYFITSQISSSIPWQSCHVPLCH